MQVSVQPNMTQLNRLKRELASAPKKLRRIEATAVRRTMKSTRAYVSKEIRNDLNIKKSALDRRNLQIVRFPSLQSPAAKIEIRGGRIPLIRFAAKQGPRSERAQYAKPGRRGTTWKVHKAGGREHERRSFIQTMPSSGHVGVFQREMTGRNKIYEMFGPSVPEVANNIPGLKPAVLAPFVEGKLEKEIDRAATRALKLK